MLILLALTIVVGLPTVGVELVAAMLVAAARRARPQGAALRRLSRRFVSLPAPA